MRGERLTAAQRDMLRRAVRSATGNPWPSMSIRERSGGAKQRMFEKMQARGWFDLGNCITPAGREAIGMKEGEDV